MTALKMMSTAAFLVLISSHAFADGIRYAGGPKTGVTTVPSTTPMPASPMDARAELSPHHDRTPAKGGIGARTP